MLYFGSWNFGQANFGKGLITTAVDETLTTSTMQVAGYRLIADCTIDPQAVVNVDIAPYRIFSGYAHLQPTATVITSGVKMEWQAWTNLGVGTATVQTSGKLAWDLQLTDDATWTNQTVE